jgi:hypothetical protein
MFLIIKVCFRLINGVVSSKRLVKGHLLFKLRELMPHWRISFWGRRGTEKTIEVVVDVGSAVLSLRWALLQLSLSFNDVDVHILHIVGFKFIQRLLFFFPA